MVRLLCVSVWVILATAGFVGVRAEGESPQSKAPSASAEALKPEEIIQKFAQKESEFYEAWMQYTYTQNAVIRVLSVDGAPQKERLTLVSEVVFNDDGSREVRLVRRTGRLRSVEFTDEDREVLENINPFALTTVELPLYDLKYEGKEKADELDCYVFSVKPKKMRRGRMYFQGKIWVDDQDLQIVKTAGKPVPQTRDNQFPEFETIRQVIDNKYWFPVYTHADSTLRFPDSVVRIEETVTYDNYKKFSADSSIEFGTEPDKDRK